MLPSPTSRTCSSACEVGAIAPRSTVQHGDRLTAGEGIVRDLQWHPQIIHPMSSHGHMSDVNSPLTAPQKAQFSTALHQTMEQWSAQTLYRTVKYSSAKGDVCSEGTPSKQSRWQRLPACQRALGAPIGSWRLHPHPGARSPSLSLQPARHCPRRPPPPILLPQPATAQLLLQHWLAPR